MFQIEKNNQRIGAYLRRLINQRFESERKFCKAYLKLQGLPTDDEETRKMQNRFSQILNGKKAIQTYDLPFVTELLGVSCEEILSAGKCFVPSRSHVTNYNVALSKNSKDWQAYIDREDKLILNYDEYGKSVLDYIFEFKNYKFLKYLTDNGYIKFHDSADTDYYYNFGAETTIKRREIFDIDPVASRIRYSNTLRMNVLELAMANNDFSVLDMLHARETPMLYFAVRYNSEPKEPDDYDCSEIVEAIATAPDEGIEYFLEEYSLTDGKPTPTCFLYQHLGDVIIAMIRNHDNRVLHVIEVATEHNNKVLSFIKDIQAEAVTKTMEQYHYSREQAEEDAFRFNSFFRNCDVASVYCHSSTKSIIANVIRADVETSDNEIMSRLGVLNSSYDMVRSRSERKD